MPRTLPILLLDEAVRRRVGYLAPPLRAHAFRHPRLDDDRAPGTFGDGLAPSKRELPQQQLRSLSGSLPTQGAVLLAAGSSWNGLRLLRAGIACLRSPGRALHAVLPVTGLLCCSQAERRGLLGSCASLCLVSDAPAFRGELSGCLEGLAAALSDPAAPAVQGLLSWCGSRHASGIADCFEELLPELGTLREGDLVVASVASGELPRLPSELVRSGLGMCSVAVGIRECGARLGILRRFPWEEVLNA